MLFLAVKYCDNLEAGLIANTNLGGDNVHRGTVLGALLGAIHTDRGVPERWTKALLLAPRILALADKLEAEAVTFAATKLHEIVPDSALLPRHHDGRPKFGSDDDGAACAV